MESTLSPIGQTINTCTIITTTPNELMEPIHNRMPAILQRDSEPDWLSADIPSREIKGLLTPFPAALMIYKSSNEGENIVFKDKDEISLKLKNTKCIGICDVVSSD